MYSLCRRIALSSSLRQFPSICEAAPVHCSKQFYRTKRKSVKKPKLPVPAEDGDLPVPPYFQHRLNIWTKLKKQHDENLKLQLNKPMKVRLPSGREIEGESWITTPLDVAKGVNYDVANQALIARVNDQLWDLERPFETDSKLEILRASEPEAQAAFWRSSSFILSEVLERASGGLVYEAAADDDGFHCDIFIEEEPFTFNDLVYIKKTMALILSEEFRFERLELTKSQLLEMFSYNRFKIEQINRLEGDKATAYRCGSFIDICDGPLVRSNTQIKGVKMKSVGWVQKDGEKVQRIHAFSIPWQNFLKKWITKKPREKK